MSRALMKGALVAGFAAATLAAGPAGAGTVVSGFDASTVPACDDCSTDAQPLGFSANFFGTTYTNTFVSNNGYVTFNSGQGSYTPTGLTASYLGQPIIAAFYADVDTRGAGTTKYGTGTYAGNTAFGVTWTGVGYYGAHTDKLNTFQLILVNRSDVGAGDFDIFFNYDQIQWETGDASGGSGGLGGVSAAAGYANGSGDPGTFAQIDGSTRQRCVPRRRAETRSSPTPMTACPGSLSSRCGAETSLRPRRRRRFRSRRRSRCSASGWSASASIAGAARPNKTSATRRRLPSPAR